MKVYVITSYRVDNHEKGFGIVEIHFSQASAQKIADRLNYTLSKDIYNDMRFRVTPYDVEE